MFESILTELKKNRKEIWSGRLFNWVKYWIWMGSRQIDLFIIDM